MSELVRTVLGDIPAAELGVTLTHEHLFIDISVWYSEPTDPSARLFMNDEPSIDTIWWFRQFPTRTRP